MAFALMRSLSWFPIGISQFLPFESSFVGCFVSFESFPLHFSVAVEIQSLTFTPTFDSVASFDAASDVFASV